MRILYDSKNAEFKKPFGTLKEGEECEINIHIPAACKTRSVSLQFFNEGGSFSAAFSLSKKEDREAYEIYSCRFNLKEAGLYFYDFLIKTENEQFELFKEGYSDTNMCKGDFWQLSCLPKDFKTPEFFKGSVMYQIFPDRFFKAGEVNLEGKLEPYSVHDDLGRVPDFLPDKNGKILNCDFFGGNLLGIEKKIPYLKKLGVSVIYLNPIFKAYSNHRYDTADYKKIDEMLGSEKDFVRLCKTAHRHNIKIILDGVFSHTGSNSVYFDKNNVFGGGAYSSPDSPYREWFDFKKYPDDYTSWWGIDTLPCVNEMSEGFKNFVIEDEDSVVSHWLRLGADGFRLDVADELPDEFILLLRKRLKKENKNALLIGEVWEDASNKISYGKRRRYFVDGELDSVMNYPFRTAIIDLVLGKIQPSEFEKSVMTICENYPKEVLAVLMNILSTHDTKRILTVLSGVSEPSSKEERAYFKLSEDELKVAEERLKAAAFLQFVLPGMPSIYYGDEILTEGFEDPFCRSFFDWKKTENNSFLSFIKSLCKLKNSLKSLKYGDTKVKVLQNGVLEIERRYKNRSACALLNIKAEAAEVSKIGKTRLCVNVESDGAQFMLSQYGFVLFEY